MHTFMRGASILRKGGGGTSIKTAVHIFTSKKKKKITEVHGS